MGKLIYILLLVISVLSFSFAQVDECLECHEESGLTTERGGRTIDLFVDTGLLDNSVHEGIECQECHTAIDLNEHPEEGVVTEISCGDCHGKTEKDYLEGVHGHALKSNKPFAPDCQDCHGGHNIAAADDPASTVYKMKIPFLCGECHREGAPVAKIYKISEHNILQNYSLSIHGEGLFKKGLTVTAACADCHSSHKILPHTDPNSTISPRNVSRTCMTCHSRIEDVHKQVIEGEKWKKAPNTIPTCTDCHLPHRARKESIVLTLSDQSCLNCHENQELTKNVDGVEHSLFVSLEDHEASVHQSVTCVKCHNDVDPRQSRPCATAGQVDCGSCHLNSAEQYDFSGHASARDEGVESAPECKTCHGVHNVKSHKDENSPTFRSAIPVLCGECHRQDGQILETRQLSETDALTDYSQSVHGKSLEKKGLLPSAVCTDCHTAHEVLNHSNPKSSVHSSNIPATCATCHKGIFKQFVNSIHYTTERRTDKKLPSCADCHSSHQISSVHDDAFLHEVTHQCGECHESLSETYFETMHGKAYRLGEMDAARCSDCHGSHDVLAVTNPESHVGMNHIVSTCQKCHEDANQRFTGYLTHATHHDQEKYPALYYTYWFMSILLISVFSFFGIHTLLWLPRSFRQMFQRRKAHDQDLTHEYVERFSLVHRVTHLLVIVSFMSLAITGMMLKFSGMAWAGFLSELIGGVKTAGTIHRLAALVTFGYFILHLTVLFKKKREAGRSWWQFIFDKNAMMFNLKDIKDFYATIKWFIGLGPRPAYGRWTYWEKFDYFAVFWGVAVIGLSGLMLWFPEFFTLFLPGWFINIATIIHSDEALLAVGFIFTIHFFNTHLRPEAFPMDKVIFTGLVPLEEFKKDRPQEYAQLVEDGQLEARIVKKEISPAMERFIAIFGFTFLTLGILLTLLIIYSVLFGYK